MTQLTPPHETNDAKPRTPLYLDRICTFTASNHAFSPPAAYRYVAVIVCTDSAVAEDHQLLDAVH